MTNLEVPKVNGADLCLKFHVDGKYRSTCSRAKSHIKLEQPNLIELHKFVKKVKENYNAFKTQHNAKQNSEEPAESVLPP